MVTYNAFVAQLVEQWIEDPRVGGSTPSEGTINYGLAVLNPLSIERCSQSTKFGTKRCE